LSKSTILKISGKKRTFQGPYKIEEYDGFYVTTVKNRHSALKKFVKMRKNENILIASGQEQEKICDGKIKQIKDISEEVALQILEKICRLSAQKFSLEIPFGEIYVFADRVRAQSIIDMVHGLSRLFTIVSPEENHAEMFDGLYYKYGTPLRQITTLCGKSIKDALIINFSQDEVAFAKDAPVINLYRKGEQGIKRISVGDIYISDKKISEEESEWGGKSGALFYSATGMLPDENATVDFGKRPDEIFMLDTDRF
jgi:hypothetical protein